jgi:putative membrane protein
MTKIIAKLLITILLLLLVANYIPGIEVSGFYIAFIVAIILGVVNLIIRPFLVLLTLPINMMTFGLFTLIINAALFWFVSTFIQGFTVDGFIPAFIGALIISLGSSLGNKFLKNNNKQF